MALGVDDLADHFACTQLIKRLNEIHIKVPR